MPDTKTRAMPSALPPSEAELAEWNALTRDEQIARYREFFAHPDCNTFTNETAEEVVAAAQRVGWAKAQSAVPTIDPQTP
jgi:hypothetical protein